MSDLLMEYNLLYKICSLLIRIQDDGDVLNEVVVNICSALKATGCSIWLSSTDGGPGQQRIAFHQAVKSSDPLPDLDFLAANLVIEQNKHFKCHNVLVDPDFADAKLDKLQVTAIPLKLNNEMLGAFCLWQMRITLENQDIDNFDSLLQKFSNEIAYGIYNYKYYSHINQKRITKELEIARRIQIGMAPKELPVIKGISLGFYTKAANEVGGDYLDLFMTDGKNLGIAIGDVMGKGVPAAMWMAMTRVSVHTAAKNDTQPHAVLQDVNSVLYSDLSAQNIFVTLMYAMYEPDRQALLFANAGHLPPLLYHSATGKYEFLRIKGPFIGGVENKKYKLGGAQLHRGDIVLFYTDGLTEAMNERQEQFGIKKVVEIIAKNSLYKATEIVDCLNVHLGQHVGDFHQSDDITFAVLKIES